MSRLHAVSPPRSCSVCLAPFTTKSQRMYCSYKCQFAESYQLAAIGKKRCPQCREVKDYGGFPRSAGRRDGVNGYCRICFSARSKARYTANKAHVTEINMRWRTENLDRLTAYQQHYTKTHAEGNREKEKRRRARKSGAVINDFTRDDWSVLLELHGNRCAYCFSLATVLTQDHVTPLSKSGDHTYLNIVPACKPCNQRKHTSGLLTFLARGTGQ